MQAERHPGAIRLDQTAWQAGQKKEESQRQQKLRRDQRDGQQACREDRSPLHQPPTDFWNSRSTRLPRRDRHCPEPAGRSAALQRFFGFLLEDVANFGQAAEPQTARIRGYRAAGELL